jgi:hypothetical protein
VITGADKDERPFDYRLVAPRTRSTMVARLAVWARSAGQRSERCW